MDREYLIGVCLIAIFGATVAMLIGYMVEQWFINSIASTLESLSVPLVAR